MLSTCNSVFLLGFYGGDRSHCLSAWQSTTCDLGIELPQDISDRIDLLFEETVKFKQKSPQELLEFLAINNHHTPFEKSSLHFQIKADIATHIHFLKHRIGVSINSESARYKELGDDCYLPEDWKDTELLTELSDHIQRGTALYHKACQKLTPSLGRKRAKESARYFLPYSKQITFDVMFNFRSFMHFQILRNSEHAQREIRVLADYMLGLVTEIEGNPFRYSINAFSKLLGPSAA